MRPSVARASVAGDLYTGFGQRSLATVTIASADYPAAPPLPARQLRLMLLAVAVVAFLARLTPVLLGGGLRGLSGGYDDGVYYAAADSLTFGRLPYQDFVLLHPPGITLVLFPFALLGRLTADPIGMSVGRVAFMAVGALNAVLVARLAARWGLAAGVLAGAVYACSFPAIYNERTTLLEPLGGTALLVALLLLLRRDGPVTPRSEVLAGVALGLGPCLKIWYVAPWGVIVLWLLLMRRYGGAARTVLGGAAAVAVIWLPFLVLTGKSMINMVILDQLSRTQTATPWGPRIQSILGVSVVPHRYPVLLVLAGTAVALFLLFGAVLCWRQRGARVVVGLLVTHVLLLLEIPVYFQHYAVLSAAPAALTAGIGVGPLLAARQGVRPRWATGLAAVVVLVILVSGVRAALLPKGQRFPGAQLAVATPAAGCVVADDDSALIAMDRLSRDLRRGCRVEVDVTGITYDRLARYRPDGKPISRRGNKDWQQYLLSYLASGSSSIVVRASNDSLAAATKRSIAARPVLAHVGRFVLHGQPR